jgi:hypothetical protein
MASATAAYNGIKKAISLGKDLEGQIGTVSKWLKASSDMDFLAKKAKNPPLFKKFLAKGSVEEEALQTFAHKKKMEAMRYDLQNWLQLSYGIKAWNELLALEGKIRKQRQDELYKAEEFRQKVIEVIAAIVFVGVLIAFIYGVYWAKQNA